jgi:hypothetical protein
MPNQNKRVSLHRILKLLFSTIITAYTTNRSVSIQVFGLLDNCENEIFSSVPTVTMSSDFVPKLKSMLRHSINALSPSVPFEEEDETSLATIIFESMYTPGRVYHSMQHVFNITGNCDVIEQDPMLVLSVLFHDVIYYSVDKNFQKSQLKLLKGVLAFENNDDETEQLQLQLQQPLTLASDAQEDPLDDMTLRLFSLEAGMTLPNFGTNEFLSAIIGVRVLSKWLSHPQLTQLAACIEGTVPFRPASSDGKTAMDRLYDRLAIVAPNQSEDWLTETIHLTATLANCDLGSFDSSNFDFFLDSSWSLIPEFRPAMLKEDCPIREYYDEFLAMEGRTKFLIASVPNIFQVFRNVPSKDELSAKQAKARANLILSNDYAQVRRLEFMVLMEFVTIVGENPDTLLGRTFLQLVLPETLPYSEDDDDDVRKLLCQGRHAPFPWDPARSSLGTFLYDRLGKEGVDAAVEVGKTETCGSHGLLNHLPKDVVEVIASSLVDVLPNRSNVLSQMSKKLGDCGKEIQNSEKLVVGEKATCASAD